MGCCQSEPIDFDAEVDITHFEIGISIGKGAFGKVRIVQHKKSKIQYAVKYMNKEEIIKRGSGEHVLCERKLLEEIHHPFIVNLRYAFQDDEHLLMILDLKLGGDLRFHLTFKGAFLENRARFYFAEVAAALNYLHEHKIVHRDIKPDNILLDDKGHASVTDFNVACKFRVEKPMTSKSGTARYMAPEVVSGTGYLNEIDWWSLAVTTYEMFYGYPPFRAKHKDELKKAIMSEAIDFSKNPKYNISETAQKLISEMLTRPKEQRLGTNENGGFKKLQQHEWFKDMDWSKVEKMEIPVPFVPDVEKNAYHDPRYGLEEMFSGRNELADKPVRNGGSIAGRRRSTMPSTTNAPLAVPGIPPAIPGDIASGIASSRSNSVAPTGASPTEQVPPATPASPTKKSITPTVPDANTEKRKSSFWHKEKEELPPISSEEELQLQLFETKYTVFDWTKPRLKPIENDADLGDLPPPPVISERKEEIATELPAIKDEDEMQPESPNVKSTGEATSGPIPTPSAVQ